MMDASFIIASYNNSNCTLCAVLSIFYGSVSPCLHRLEKDATQRLKTAMTDRVVYLGTLGSDCNVRLSKRPVGAAPFTIKLFDSIAKL